METKEQLVKQIKAAKVGSHLTVNGSRYVRCFAGRVWLWVNVESGDCQTADQLVSYADRRGYSITLDA